MATRLIGTDDADPRLPALVIAATQGTTAADLAPGDVAGTWTSYTPTLTSWVIGNGTRTGRYIKQGRLVHFWALIVFGSTSTYSGSPTISLPVTAAAGNPLRTTVNCFYSDVSTSGTAAGRTIFGTTAVQPLVFGAASTFVNDSSLLSSTAPFTWATGDGIDLSGWYEAAT